MDTNREHQATTEANKTEIEDLSELTAPIADGLTGEFEGVFKKITIVNGIITEFELEE